MTYELKTPPSVIHNGRRAIRFAGEQAPELFAFTAGRLWDEGKDLATLDRAAARIVVPVLAAGPLHGPNGAQVAAKHVQTLGHLTDMEVARYLGQRPIFVSMARYEPFGLAVLEAAQAGCSLILSDIPTFRELWDSAALFVPPGDDETLAQTITHLAQNRHERDRLGRSAQKTAQAYTLEAMSMKMLHVYRSLVSSKRNISSVEDAA